MTRGAKRTKVAAADADLGAAAASTAPEGVSAVGVAALSGDYKPIAQGLVDFINYAWTPYHAVEEASRLLLAAGFQHLSEKAQWSIKPGGKYFFTRNMSTICAFAVGKQYQAGNGFYMVGAHTDSPCLKLKPVSKSSRNGWLLVNVEPYGGGLWYTWFDRDLGLAGRVLVKEGGAITQHLVKVDKPLMRIPMLAIHLQRDIHTAGFKPNLQTNFAPLLATSVKSALGLTSATSDKSAPAAASGPAAGAAAENGGGAKSGTGETGRHHPVLMSLLAEQLGVQAEDIIDFELHVCDTQPGVVGGIQQEFIYAGRLDNLAMSYIALQAMLDSCVAEEALDAETGIRAVALFDHEEVGSDSAQGAGGTLMRDTITRVAGALSAGQEGAVERATRSSYLVSADMAHALHPLYADKHDPEHQPKLHEGLVLKHNANQRYATNAVSAALFREVARRHDIPCQEFSVRNDMPCGSTIGPILASSLGCRTVDVGIPQLSMHSIREMCGTDDVGIAYRHLLAFYQEFSKLDATLDVDSLPPPSLRGTITDTACHHLHAPRGALIDPVPAAGK